MTDVENLKQTSLHDMSVNSLNIDFEHRELTILLAVYNEVSQSYDELKLEFQGIDNLNLNPMSLTADGFNALEIYTHTVTQTIEELAIEFQLLTGRDQSGAIWSFSFERVRLVTN
ncbi:hypothetical protein [Hymenobacter negativus]|uniref:Uncharacterized protein n=1 Tax=Hymenobacter negativus TaxID=2795026 RepID=A0ABS3QCU6_9BACT|nr:hypothetical protein [Hymenobacter negativus]MBO2009065.1 hypothetical protein [Hymenobacter negativus]